MNTDLSQAMRILQGEMERLARQNQEVDKRMAAIWEAGLELQRESGIERAAHLATQERLAEECVKNARLLEKLDQWLRLGEWIVGNENFRRDAPLYFFTLLREMMREEAQDAW